jgi:hypothetical protein
VRRRPRARPWRNRPRARTLSVPTAHPPRPGHERRRRATCAHRRVLAPARRPPRGWSGTNPGAGRASRAEAAAGRDRPPGRRAKALTPPRAVNGRRPRPVALRTHPGGRRSRAGPRASGTPTKAWHGRAARHARVGRRATPGSRSDPGVVPPALRHARSCARRTRGHARAAHQDGRRPSGVRELSGLGAAPRSPVRATAQDTASPDTLLPAETR